MTGKFPILIVEDNEDDAFLIRSVLSRAGFKNPVHICQDGLEAVDYLKGESPYEDRGKYHFPRLLITDLKMPRMDGFELLAWIQKHPECNVIPRIVLSSSGLEADVKLAYQLGVNSFFVKPPTLDGLLEVLRAVFDYWGRCSLPSVPAKC